MPHRHLAVKKPPYRIAVIGAGIAGLGAAYLLGRRHHVTLFEAEHRLGGHSHTVEVLYDGVLIPVDTGFIVYNERNYPNLTRLFAELEVPTQASDMSFSVSIGGGRREWAGSNLATLFAQPSNLLRPGFHRMLRDVLRFNRQTMIDLRDGALKGQTLGDYLDAGNYSRQFRLDYLLPMGAAIWSAPIEQMLQFPAASFVRFFANHGLLGIADRPAWRSVAGGSREYVRRLMARFRGDVRLASPVAAVVRRADHVLVRTSNGSVDRFDHVVMATHSDQAARLLEDATALERRILGAVRYQPNRAVLHRDPTFMPRRRKTWSAWNYGAADQAELERSVSLTYWMNRLQNIDPARPLFVTLNPMREPDPTCIFASFRYDHPLFDQAAVAAQADLKLIQGQCRTWFAGAWCGYGFHEDGLKSAVAVALAFGAAPDWPSDVLPPGSLPLPEAAAIAAAGE
jgi:predicted NAD/FAD-binding protein